MDGFTIDDLRLRHETVAKAREDAQREAREKDLGFAYVLGELETLIGILEAKAKRAAEQDIAALAELERLAGLAAGIEKGESEPISNGCATSTDDDRT